MNFVQIGIQELGGITHSMKHRLPRRRTSREIIEPPVLGITAVLIAVAAYAAIFFAVSFPYSLGIAELLIFAAFILSLFILRYNILHLVAPLVLLLIFVIQVFWFAQPADLAAGSAQMEFGSIYQYIPYLQTDMDISLAVDSLLQKLLFVSVLLLTFYLSAKKSRLGKAIYGAIAIIGVVTIVLGLISPRDNSRILWFYNLPKVEVNFEESDNYVSPVVHILSSSLNGFIWKYDVGDIEVSLDQKQISTNPIAGVVNENMYAGLLGITAPLVFGIVIYMLNRSPPLMFAAMALVSAVLLLLLTIGAHSRGGALACVLSFLAVFFLRKSTTHILVTFFCALVAVVVISFIATAFDSDEVFKLSSGRTVAWHETLALFADNPLFGIGLGNFPGYEIIVDHRYQNSWQSSHNVYLQSLAELGIGGILAYAILVALMAMGMRRKHAVQVGYRVVTLSVSVLFVIIYAAIDFSVSMPFNAILAAMVVGLLMGELYAPRLAGTTGTIGSGLLKSSLVLLFLFGMIMAALKSDMEARLQDLRRAVGESVIFKEERSGRMAASGMPGKLQEHITSFSCFPYNAEYARYIGLGYLVVSEGVDKEQMEKAWEWLSLSQHLGVESRYVKLTMLGIRGKLDGHR